MYGKLRKNTFYRMYTNMTHKFKLTNLLGRFYHPYSITHPNHIYIGKTPSIPMTNINKNEQHTFRKWKIQS